MNCYEESILRAGEYIEKHLNQDISLSDVIKCTGYSPFHFMRVFKSIFGYSVNDYIRRRKMTEAAGLLLNTDMKIIDIALLYAYNSQEAFTRAFKEIFNTTPNLYRVNKTEYVNLQQVTITDNILKLRPVIKPIEPMLIERDSFTIVGLEYKGKNNNYEVPKLWNDFCKYYHKIPNIISHDVFYGYEDYDECAVTGNFRYITGVETSEAENLPEGFAAQRIEKSKYAVFPLTSIVESIPRNISEIYTVHIPNSGLNIKGDYDFEYYDHDSRLNHKDSLLHFYVPVEG